METTDFIPPDSLYWSTKEEFISMLTGLTRDTLAEQSETAKRYFEENFQEKIVAQRLRNDNGIMPEGVKGFADDRILEIMDSSFLFDKNFRIDVQKMPTPPAPKTSNSNTPTKENKIHYSKWTIFTWNIKVFIKKCAKKILEKLIQ